MGSVAAVGMGQRTDSWEARTMARVAAGDQAALADVYDQYSPLVYGLALRILADSAAAEDVAQEVFVSVWERPHGFDPERGTLRAWLGVITHRRAVDRVRRDTAARRRETAEAGQLGSPPPDIAEAATSMVVAERLHAAVELLPTDQRVAIQLAYFGGKTFREVARLLGIPEGTAKSRLRIGLQKLAATLGDEGITSWT